MLSQISSLRAKLTRSKYVAAASLLLVVLCVWLVVQPADAPKFTDRSIYINSSRPSDTTFYIISFQYTTTAVVGSVKMEFCTSPIATLPCYPPSGMDLSGASLTAQAGETGFVMDTPSPNVILLSRTAAMTGPGVSSYRFDNVVNPDATGANADPREPEHEKTNFYVRLSSHASTDGSGPEIDVGSVSATITPELGVLTQVPPILIFCVGVVINDDECEDVDGFYVDFGELSSDETFYTASQMQARTNAQYGYSIYVEGNTLTSGIRSIPAITTPTQSLVGVGQFGINLADNSDPDIGADPVGPGIGAILNPVYATPDHYLYNEGDVLVTSSGVTPVRKFTVSYILNVPEDQEPGVYSTTITYVCTAGF